MIPSNRENFKIPPFIVDLSNPSRDTSYQNAMHPNISDINNPDWEETQKLRDDCKNCFIIAMITFFIFPFWPFGLAAIAFTALAKDAININNAYKVETNLKSAQFWMIANVVASLVFYSLFLIVIFCVYGVLNKYE